MCRPGSRSCRARAAQLTLDSCGPSFRSECSSSTMLRRLKAYDGRLLEPAALADDQPTDRESALVGIDQPEVARVAGHVEPANGVDRLARLKDGVEWRLAPVRQRIVAASGRVSEIDDGALFPHRHAPRPIRQAKRHRIAAGRT